MTATTKVEKDLIIRIVKDFVTDYNPSSIAKELGVTRVGTFKALRELEKKGLVKGRNLGKARFYKVDLGDEYSKKNVEVLLMEQSREFKRWVEEFKELSELVQIIILFGSIVRNEKNANDVDVLLVYDKKVNDWVNTIIKEKNEMLLKKIHPIKQTKEDLIRNIQQRDKVILSAIKGGVILHGFGELLGVIKDVTCKQ